MTGQKIAFGFRQRGGREPAAAPLAEQVPGVSGDEIGVQNGLNPALHPSYRSHQRRALRDQTPQVLRLVVCCPNLWQESGGMKLCQDLGINLVGLHPRVGDGLHLEWIGNHDPRDKRNQQPDDGRCISGRFQHDLVVLPQGLSEGHDRVEFKLDPQFFRDPPSIEDRDLCETSMHIPSDRPHAKPSLLSIGECTGCATSTDTRSQRRRDSRRGGQITTRARSSKSIRPARFFALRRPCPDRATLP